MDNKFNNRPEVEEEEDEDPLPLQHYLLLQQSLRDKKLWNETKKGVQQEEALHHQAVQLEEFGRVLYFHKELDDLPLDPYIKVFVSTPLQVEREFGVGDLPGGDTWLKPGYEGLGITSLNSLQRVAAAHILRGDDCFIVGGTGGKTVSYMGPILGKLIVDHYNDKGTRKPGSAPFFIILCSDDDSAANIKTVVDYFLMFSGQRHLNCQIIGGNKDVPKLKNDVNIVISPIQFFSGSILDKGVYYSVEFHRVEFLVFEDFNVIQALDTPTLLKTLEIFDYFYQGEGLKPVAFQRIFVSRRWTQALERFILELKPLGRGGGQGQGQGDLLHLHDPWAPTVFINSPNQLIRYAELNWIFHHVKDDDEKIQIVWNLLRSEQIFNKKVFIICSTPGVATLVHEWLETGGLSTTLCVSGEETLHHPIPEASACWGGGRDLIDIKRSEWLHHRQAGRQIMVLDDGILYDLEITDVDCLIHFDLPGKDVRLRKINKGTSRFYSVSGNMRRITQERLDKTSFHLRTEIVTHFLLTGNEPDFLKIWRIAKDAPSSQIPETFTETIKILEAKDLEGRRICMNLKLFGECVQNAKCKDRHEFIPSDLELKPCLDRNKGYQIKIEITECHNPSLYSGRILQVYEYRDGRGYLVSDKEVSFKNLTSTLIKRFNDPANKIEPQSYEPGTECLVETLEGIFHRARILRILTRFESKFPKQLEVFSLDTGNRLAPTVDRVFALPEELGTQTIPKHAIEEVILAELVPPGGRAKYNASHTEKARGIVLDKTVVAKVRFTVRQARKLDDLSWFEDTIWVVPMVELGEDKVIKMYVRETLRTEGCADIGNDHLKNILHALRHTGYYSRELDGYARDPWNDRELRTLLYRGDDGYHQYQWAWMEQSHLHDPVEVDFRPTFLNNPHAIFGNLEKFQGQKDELIDELNQFVKKWTADDKYPDYADQLSQRFKAGMVVAVKDYDGRWVRGQITALTEDAFTPTFRVFLVDEGFELDKVETKRLFPMPSHLVKNLPFQAISLRLDHIKPVGGGGDNEGWGLDDMIDDLEEVLYGDKGEAQCIQVVAYEKVGDAPNIYKAFIFLPDDRELGQILVNKGLATYATEEGEVKIRKVHKAILAHYEKIVNAATSLGEGEDDENEMLEMQEGEEEQEGLWEFCSSVFRVPKGQLEDATPPPTPAKPAQEFKIPKGLPPPPQKPGGTGGNPGWTPNPRFKGPKTKTPTVSWTQTLDDLILIVHLQYVREFSLQLKDNGHTLIFSCQDPKGYTFTLPFYGKITQLQSYVYGQSVKIIGKKLTRWLWLRVTKSPRKLTWLKPLDEEGQDEGQDEDTPEDPNQIPYEEVDEDEEGEDDSEDEGMITGADAENLMHIAK